MSKRKKKVLHHHRPPPTAAVAVTEGDNASIQAKVNELIWQHGTNLPNRAEWPERLKEIDLTPQEVTLGMLRKAAVIQRQRLASDLTRASTEELIWQKPVEEDNHVSTWTTWWTECRMYRVTRSIAKFGGGDNSFRLSYIRGTQLPNDNTQMDVLAKHFRSLEAAFVAVEELHMKMASAGSVRSNRKTRLAEAKAAGFDELPAVAAYNDKPVDNNLTQTDEENAMYVSEETARKVLAAAGVEGADNPEKMNKAKLLKRCNDLPNLEGVREPETQEECDVYKKMVAALTKGKEISFELKTEKHGKAQQNGRTPKAAKAKKEKNPNTPAKEGGAKDKFGSRIGSNTAKINACLSKKTKTMADILKEADLTGTRYNHMNKLIEAGFVVKDGNGYKLKS